MYFWRIRKILKRVRKAVSKKLRRIQKMLNDHFVFKSATDKKIYYDLSQGKISGSGEVKINIKTAGNNPIYCRNNHIDHHVIDTTFFGLYHLPPKKLKSNPVILDLGSNIGLTIRHLKYLYPRSSIIGVELDHQNYLLSKKNLQGLDNCISLNAAIWYKDGVVSYSGVDEQSYFCMDGTDGEHKKAKSVSLITLFKDYNLSCIDYVKMDIEGAESVLFNKDCEWLNNVQSINIEVHNGEPLNKYISVLDKYGFTSKISSKHWSSVLAYK